jgi:hypothetical protein
METWAPTISFRIDHSPCLSLGRTACFRSDMFAHHNVLASGAVVHRM